VTRASIASRSQLIDNWYGDYITISVKRKNFYPGRVIPRHLAVHAVINVGPRFCATRSMAVLSVSSGGPFHVPSAVIASNCPTRIRRPKTWPGELTEESKTLRNEAEKFHSDANGQTRQIVKYLDGVGDSAKQGR
jgi:hypothetical protein